MSGKSSDQEGKTLTEDEREAYEDFQRTVCGVLNTPRAETKDGKIK